MSIQIEETNTNLEAMVITFDNHLPKGKTVPFRGYKWVDEAIGLICEKENAKNPIAQVTPMHIIREIYANGIAPFMTSRGYPPNEEAWKVFDEASIDKMDKTLEN